MNYVRLILSLAGHFRWQIHQMDVKSAFLHGNLSEEIYMEQPPDFMIDFSLFYRLHKSLYGLKQAPWAWYEKIDQLFLDMGFKQCESDNSIHVLHVKGDTFVVVYVDELVLTRNNSNLIFRLKSQLVNIFEMIDLGIFHFFIGFKFYLSQMVSFSLNISMYQIC